jgi:predicted nucleotide-binding protein
MLRVLITGSGSRYEVDHTGAICSGDKFIELCETLGKVLALRQHQVFLLSDDDRHADPHVFRGYATQAQQQRTQAPPIRLSYGDPSDPENRSTIKFRTYREQFPDVVVEDVDVSGNYPYNRVSIVRDVDVVIAIGGEEGVRQFVEIAEALDKPLIPIAAFGGVAEHAWTRRELAFRTVFRIKTEPLTKYFGDTSMERVAGIADAAEEMVRTARRQLAGSPSGNRISFTSRTPRVFVGSSSEGLPLANKIQELLANDHSVVVWNQGTVFGLGSATLEALEEAVAEYDAAIFVFTPDDELVMRGEVKPVARDNVLFELGLFIGKLGRRRAFAVNPRSGRIALPTDLSGIATAEYDPDEPNLAARLGPSCNRLRTAIATAIRGSGV